MGAPTPFVFRPENYFVSRLGRCLAITGRVSRFSRNCMSRRRYFFPLLVAPFFFFFFFFHRFCPRNCALTVSCRYFFLCLFAPLACFARPLASARSVSGRDRGIKHRRAHLFVRLSPLHRASKYRLVFAVFNETNARNIRVPAIFVRGSAENVRRVERCREYSFRRA